MNQAGQTALSGSRRVVSRSFVIGRSFVWWAPALDVIAILASSLLAAGAYHWFSELSLDPLPDHAGVGAIMAMLYVTVRMARGGYDVKSACSGKIGFLQIVAAWNLAMCAVLILSVLTKMTSTYYSRGSLVLFYAGGLGSLVVIRAMVVGLVRRGLRQGWLSTSHVLLIGTPDRIEDFLARHELRASGLHVVDTVFLPDVATVARQLPRSIVVERAGALERAVEQVRQHRIDDVFLVVPWGDHVMIEQAADAFLNVPAKLHLGTERILDRFADVTISRTGPVAGLELVRPALGPTEIMMKRVLDVTLALSALVLLAPLFMILALVIKLDTPGRVFFRQKRYGFNQEQFEIIKFRSMTTTEEGDDVKQVKRNDKRVTRVGRWLRRTNLDELPQLLNVLRGEMSIVGPRPHAIIHNREYEQKIARYARRHNVKPGITGWAQINGFRGETDTDAKMRARVKCDLYYIDNWSLTFDLYIIFKTIFSARAYRNAH